MSTALSSAEEMVVGLLRQLPPAVVQEVHDFVLFLAARHSGWTYDDQASIERAADLMAADAFVLGEVRAINEDFACAEADGLARQRPGRCGGSELATRNRLYDVPNSGPRSLSLFQPARGSTQ